MDIALPGTFSQELVWVQNNCLLGYQKMENLVEGTVLYPIRIPAPALLPSSTLRMSQTGSGCRAVRGWLQGGIVR